MESYHVCLIHSMFSSTALLGAIFNNEKAQAGVPSMVIIFKDVIVSAAITAVESSLSQVPPLVIVPYPFTSQPSAMSQPSARQTPIEATMMPIMFFGSVIGSYVSFNLKPPTFGFSISFSKVIITVSASRLEFIELLPTAIQAKFRTNTPKTDAVFVILDTKGKDSEPSFNRKSSREHASSNYTKNTQHTRIQKKYHLLGDVPESIKTMQPDELTRKVKEHLETHSVDYMDVRILEPNDRYGSRTIRVLFSKNTYNPSHNRYDLCIDDYVLKEDGK